MKRRPRTHAEPARYATVEQVRERRVVLQGLAAIAGLAVIPGCFFTGGKGPYTGEDPSLYTVFLPVAGSVRTLYFSTGGDIDYHVEVVVWGQELATWLEDNTDAMLELLDALFGVEDVTLFADGVDRSALQVNAIQVLADAWRGQEGAPTDGFESLTLVVDAYNPDGELDGDMPDSGL